jgi:mono/diheme cytochrome c family protein
MRTTRHIRNLARLALATALTVSAVPTPAAGPVVYVSQGPNWGPSHRQAFYRTDQGSRLIPLKWAKALKQPNGLPFLDDGLARFGYLPNPSGQHDLPIGFMAAGQAGREDLAMNCSACHTRQIVVDNTQYRIDGGPALVDFQGLLTGLVAAVGHVLDDQSAFAAFASDLGIPAAEMPALRQSMELWYEREHTLVERALPGNLNWGLGRLDAVSMIYNRLAGMDLGPPPSYLIKENIRPAKAPVRYPFLWNAPRQDRTQWPGFAQNGDDVLGLGRNLGQVYGVFGIYRPRRVDNEVDFLAGNSAQWGGLEKIEGLIKKIGAPKWPWGYDPGLASLGKAVFDRDWENGGCVQCHGERRGALRILRPIWEGPTWATPLCDVGTDTAQYDILHRDARSGLLEGSRRPFGQPMPESTDVFGLLAVSVIGSIFQHTLGFSLYSYDAAGAERIRVKKLAEKTRQKLVSTYAPESSESCPIRNSGPEKYESRVLKGIWAAAPYLHNGSVPTLSDLLKPAGDRPKAFELGNRYSTKLMGLDRDQGPSATERDTKGCSDLDSGESRCGHDYGTNLKEAEKAALLEYLKSI